MTHLDPTVDALRPELAKYAAALGLHLAPSVETLLLQYLTLLQRWNMVYNLTALRDPARMLTHHLMDCLAVEPALRRHLAKAGQGGGTRLLDVGSGGGLPGVVLAMLESGLQVTCIDAVAKKAGFLRQAAGELGLPNLTAVHTRAEDFRPAALFDIITSRAFASLADFVTLTRHLLAPGGVWLAMKGIRPDDEIAALPGDVAVFHVEPLVVPGLNASRCLIWITLKGGTA